MRPLVIIPCDVKQIGVHPFHCVGEKYINAVAHCAGVAPLLLPGMGAGLDLAALDKVLDIDRVLDLVDGVFLTGSVSNVDPVRYGNQRQTEMATDFQRDATVFPLIDRALARKIPIMAVCRGFQELNVALGGTLHARVHEVSGMRDHREPEGVSRDEMYAPSHGVEVMGGGRFEHMLPRAFVVNSLHGQGIDQLAPSLRAEAVAPDGLVEGVSLDGQFVVGVQWHPEWAASQNPESTALFRAFGDAVREYAKVRR
jgi:putative glutamine amidotransferase